MTAYKSVSTNPVPCVYQHKWDGHKIAKTEHEYKFQKGSARSVAFALLKDGMLIETWAKKCAEAGVPPQFAIESLDKYQHASKCGWVIGPKSDGTTLEQTRKVRSVDPEVLEKREAAAKEREQKKADRMKAKEEKAKAKEAAAKERAEKKAAADKEKADKAAQAAEAKRQKEAEKAKSDEKSKPAGTKSKPAKAKAKKAA